MNKLCDDIYIMDELKNKFNDLLVQQIYVLSSATIKRFKKNWDNAKTDKRRQQLYNTLIDFKKYGVLTLKDLKSIKKNTQELQSNPVEEKTRRTRKIRNNNMFKNLINDLVDKVSEKKPIYDYNEEPFKETKLNVDKTIPPIIKQPTFLNIREAIRKAVEQDMVSYKDKLDIFIKQFKNFKNINILKNAILKYENENNIEGDTRLMKMKGDKVYNYIKVNNYNVEEIKNNYNELSKKK